MPPITRASCQSENFTITNHNIHYTKRQLISHQHQHTPTPTHTNDKIKPNSKSHKTAKKKKRSNNKAKDSAKQWANHRVTVQKRERLLKNKES